MRPFSSMFKKLRKIFCGKLTSRNSMKLLQQRKNLLLEPMVFPKSIYRCAGGSGSHFLFDAYKCVLEGGAVSTHFARSRTIFTLKSSTAEDNGLIVRSLDALRPLTLCNCDCKIITTAICFGLHRYSIRCIRPAQRCISSRQMTDNIFEVEMTALAHVACSTNDSGIFLTFFCLCVSQCQSHLDLPRI